MSSCERCWSMSCGDPDLYNELLESNDCTPEQQAGRDADVCESCHRKTIHVLTGMCMNENCTARNQLK